MSRLVVAGSLALLLAAASGCLFFATLIRLNVAPGTVRVERGGRDGADARTRPDAVVTLTILCGTLESGALPEDDVRVEIVAGLPSEVSTHVAKDATNCTNDPRRDRIGGTLGLAVNDAPAGRYEVQLEATLFECEAFREFGLPGVYEEGVTGGPAGACSDGASFTLVIDDPDNDDYSPPDDF